MTDTDASSDSLMYVDTNILVYLLESGEHTHVATERIAHHLKSGGSLVTSVVTLTELIAGAVQDAALSLSRMSLLQIVPLDIAMAERAGLLRRQHKLQPLDAIHLATALHAGADLIFTNDRHFAKAIKPHMPIMEL